MYRIKRSVLYYRPIQWVIDFFGVIDPDSYAPSATREEAWKKMESIKSAYQSADCLWHHKYVPIHTVTGFLFDKDSGVFRVLLKSGTPVITFRIKEETK